MKTNTCAGSLLLVLATIGAIHAQAPTGKPLPRTPEGPAIDFVAVDKDTDGRLSREEALLVPDLTSAFEMLDSNRDEFISPTEFSRWSRAGKVDVPPPPDKDAAAAPGGSAGAQRDSPH